MEKLSVELSQDEWLVFWDWLSRFNEESGYQFKDQAEQRVLWDIEAQIEKKSDNAFAENYIEALKSAYERIRDEVG